MAPAFARRTPQQQPLTASGRPKRATTLRKEAIKEEEDDAKTKALKEKADVEDAKTKALKEKADVEDTKTKALKEKADVEDEKDKKVESKKGRSKASSKRTKSESGKEDADKMETDNITEKGGEPSEKVDASVDEAARKTWPSRNKKTEDGNKDGGENKGEINPEEKPGEGKESESEPDDGEVDDDEDKDFDPDDDPEKLWCFCKKPHGNRFMICCDSCEDWFHGDCIGITMERGRDMERTGEEWCCNGCTEKKAKAAQKKTIGEKNSSLATSPLNTPLGGKKTTDAIPITKAKNISLDNLKANLARSMKGSEKAKPAPTDNKTTEEKTQEQIKSVESIKTDVVTPEKPAKEKDSSKPKRRESNKQEFTDLLTFDQIPIKREREKEEVSKKRTQEPVSERKHERHDSQSSEDDNKKRKKEDTKKTSSTKVRSNSQSKPVEPPKSCVRTECNRPVMKGAIYCSRECIYKYANESLKYIDEEKKKSKDVGKSPEMKQESAKGTVICPATSSTDRVSDTTQERIAVFEKSTGKVVAGVMAPTKKYLFAWLEEHPTYEVLKPGKQPADVKNSKNQDEVIRSNVRKSLRDILVLRCKETEMAINHEVVGKLSKMIESELLKMFNNETGQKYKTKYRSLIFNLKDRQNKILYKRVVSGEISPRKLVQMSPEQLATPELAQWRQQENKHHLEMVKKRELDDAEIKKNPPIKKTHKGEVVIDDEKVSYETLLELKSEPIIDRKPKSLPSDMENLLKDTTDEHTHHLFDSNCKICTGKVAPPGEPQITGVSTTIIQAVPESSMPSPQLDETESYVSSSPPSPDTSSITSPIMSPSPTPRNPPSVRKQPSVWRGFIVMQKVAKFVCTAYAVSGSCESLMDVLPDTIHVCGRIPPSQVWDYLGLLREGRKSHYKYLDVIRFEMSSDEEKSGYIKLYTYFYTRQRIGVIGNCYAGIKDIYILPLASHDPIPTELRPLPGLPKPRPHMLLGIIVRVKSEKVKVNEFVDSSPEMVIPPKKKKKKKDKKKEKEMVKETEKDKSERDIERERAEITLERERVELEAQKKLIDIIFKNRANEGLTPESLIQQASAISGGVSTMAPLVSSPQPLEAMKTVLQSDPSKMALPFSEKVRETVTSISSEKMDEGIKQIEEEQLTKIKEQQEEITRLQSTVAPTQEDSDMVMINKEEAEMVMIPDPESIAKDIRENVLNQITEAIQEVSEPEVERETGGTFEREIASTSGVTTKAERMDSEVDTIVSLRNINASLVRPLTDEEKDPIFKAWLERPTNVAPLGQQHDNLIPTLSPENDILVTENPVSTSPDLSPSTQAQPSSGFASPTSNIDQAHVQNLLSSISSSIAHVQSMVVTDPNEVPATDDGITAQSSFEPVVSSSSPPPDGRSYEVKFEDTSDFYSSTQDIDKDVLQDIEERFRPAATFPEDILPPIAIQSIKRETPDIPALGSPTDISPGSPPCHNMPGVVDISPPSKPMSPIRPISPPNNTIPLVGAGEERESDDDYALNLIEDIQIPTHIPKRATLFSLDLIKMRAGVKMPELPDIKLPDKKECKTTTAVSVPPPPIPAVIPTVPIPPDIKLPPGVPFPPLPPAPPPSSDAAGAMPVAIEPVEDLRTLWTSSAAPSIANNSSNRPVLSAPLSNVNVPRFNRPPFGISSDHSLPRQPSLSDPVTSKPMLPVRSMDDRTRDARIPPADGPQFRDHTPTGAVNSLPNEPGSGFMPMYSGIPPPSQNILGPRQIFRMPPRIMESCLTMRFPPPPVAPPGPPPQRPMLGNRFLPPGGPVPMHVRFPPPGEHFPPDQPVPSERGFHSPIENNPALRGSNPRTFDVRNPGPRFDHPSKFPEAHDLGRNAPFRPPLFDVPRPRRPLEPQLELDRPERMPPPFEPRGPPPFKPEPPRPSFEPGIQRPSFEPEIRPIFEHERQRSPFPSEPPRPHFKPEHSSNSRVRGDRSPPRDHGPPYHDEGPYYNEFDDERRDRRHDRPDYDRSDQGHPRNNHGKFYHKNRQKFGKYSRHGSYEGRRDPPRSSEFRYRSKDDDMRERETYDSKDFGGREDGPSKPKQKRTKSNKYAALSSSAELEELEEGEVL